MHQISTLYYGWSAAAADINHDGTPDIVSGPFYYLGPSYTERHIYRVGRVYNPATEYAPDMVNFAYDFTGDGWPDILASEWDRTNGTRPIDLYVNPKGADRRWDAHDHSADAEHRKRPDARSRRRRQARDDLRDGDRLRLGEAGPGESDGAVARSCRLGSERPAKHPWHGWRGRRERRRPRGHRRQQRLVRAAGCISGTEPWTFHPFDFATATTEMGVYDVNGDRLTDIVASLSVHDWGLAWFEQKKGSRRGNHVRPPRHRRRLFDQERRRRRLFRSPRRSFCRHERRQDS